MSKQSSVDWLITELNRVQELYYGQSIMPIEVIAKAKAMHKEEIQDSFGVGCHVESTRLIGYHGMAEQYYNETFNI